MKRTGEGRFLMVADSLLHSRNLLLHSRNCASPWLALFSLCYASLSPSLPLSLSRSLALWDIGTVLFNERRRRCVIFTYLLNMYLQCYYSNNINGFPREIWPTPGDAHRGCALLLEWIIDFYYYIESSIILHILLTNSPSFLFYKWYHAKIFRACVW